MFPFARAISFVEHLLLLVVSSITWADKKAPCSAVELCPLPNLFLCIISRDVGQYGDFSGGAETKKYWRNYLIQCRTWLSLRFTGSPEKFPLLWSGLKSRTKTQDILQHFSSILLTDGCFGR